MIDLSEELTQEQLDFIAKVNFTWLVKHCHKYIEQHYPESITNEEK